MKATTKNAGISLWGDSVSLEELYDLTHKCWDSLSITDETLRDILYNFSYDLRKAYSGARDYDYIEDSSKERIPIYGVKINWLLVLLSINYIRYSFAYLETTKKDQSIIYLLEYYVEKIVNEQFSKTSYFITNTANQFISENQENFSPKFLNAENYFLSLTTKSKRTTELLPILKSLLSLRAMSDEDTLMVSEKILLNNGYCPETVKW